MKVDELRVLEEDELGGRLKAARRELYELRFKHAVGQLENASQISKVRHDIARIMTVLTERQFGIVAQAAPGAITIDSSPAKGAAKAKAQAAEPKAEPKAKAEPAGPDAGPDTDDTKPKRGRTKAARSEEKGS
jgi:large subunit ribosomal protein L29